MGQNHFKKLALLLDAAKNGSEDAFRELYRETRQAQLYHLRTLLKDPEEVQDALQEVYILLYKNMDKIDPPTVLVAYLNRLSYFVGKNMAKKLYRRSSHLADFDWMKEICEPKAEEQLSDVEKAELRQIVRATIDKLPERERLAVFMRFYQKLRHQDVALSLGISLDSAKRLQRTAQRHLKELLIKEGFSGIEVMLPGALGHLLSSAMEHNIPGSNSFRTPALSSASSHSFTAGLAAVGISAVLVGGGSMTGPPDITAINTPAPYVKAPASVEICVKSALPVRTVQLTDSHGDSVYGKLTAPRIYTVNVKKNGAYKVAVTSNTGRTSVRQTEISCLDTAHPQASREIKNGKLYVTMWDEESGIDFGSLYCEGAKTGRIEPVSVDRDMGIAVFSLPQESVTFHMRDTAGNEGTLPVIYNK